MRIRDGDMAEYMSLSQVARASGYSESLVRLMANQGEIETLSTPIGRLIHQSAVATLIQRRMEKHPATEKQLITLLTIQAQDYASHVIDSNEEGLRALQEEEK